MVPLCLKGCLRANHSRPYWTKFFSFHGKNWELRDIVAGYGCINLFMEESEGEFSYIGPRLHRERENNSTFFTWKYKV